VDALAIAIAADEVTGVESTAARATEVVAAGGRGDVRAVAPSPDARCAKVW
jgi:hypothetical protein